MTEVELPSLLSDLQESAQKLNNESAAMNSIISSIESRLVQMNLGVECWLENSLLGVDDNGSSTETASLGFAKVNGQWGLFIKVYKQGTAGLLETLNLIQGVPLSRASRELRIAALAKMPTLVKQLSDEVKRKLKTIEDAKLLVK